MNKTILVVDDEKLIRELCSKALEKYNIVTAERGEEALRIIDRGRIDLVITDVMMPGMSGIELLKEIKSKDPNASVIVMTGFSEKEVILSALKEGADDFINKPLNIMMLKSTIEKSLQKKRLREELAHLKSVDTFKTNFISLISHKFRTPITALSLFLQNLKQGVYDCNSEHFPESVNLAIEESEYLSRLIDNLLFFSSIMASGDVLHLEKCPLEEIVRDVLFKIKHSRKGLQNAIDLKVSTPGIMLDLDRKKIGFVVEQLIDNAIKFSGYDTEITVSISSDDTAVLMSVSDTGIGIPEHELPKIFEKFYQIDQDNTGQVQGFGLGLFYVREFIYQHSGGIHIDSTPGLGATLTVSIPRITRTTKEV